MRQERIVLEKKISFAKMRCFKIIGQLINPLRQNSVLTRMFEAGVLTEKHRKRIVWDPRVRLATLWKLLKREEWLKKKIWKGEPPDSSDGQGGWEKVGFALPTNCCFYKKKRKRQNHNTFMIIFESRQSGQWSRGDQLPQQCPWEPFVTL